MPLILVMADQIACSSIWLMYSTWHPSACTPRGIAPTIYPPIGNHSLSSSQSPFFSRKPNGTLDIARSHQPEPPPPMSDKTMASSAAGSPRKQQSRLKRRAPPSLQIACPASHWNVAIPLLSPLASSPTSPELIDRPEAAEVRSPEAPQADQEKKPIIFKTWQHPAAPFCYDPAPMNPSFVPV